MRTAERPEKEMTRVLLIAGWGRSGSTILANVLGSAPGVLTLGEINNIWERGFEEDLHCSCGEPFSACSLWQPVASRAFGDDFADVGTRAKTTGAGLGNTWLLRRRLPFVGSRLAGREVEYAKMVESLYSAAAEETGARLLVDASKSPWHCAVAASLASFDVSVLHLYRDPRGVAHSLRKKIDYDPSGRKIEMDRHSSTASSLAWIYRNRLVESEWRGSERFLQMRYEDFVADPQAAVAEIQRLVGLEDLDVPFVNHNKVDIAPTHNISGNPVRFRRGAVALRPDDEWKQALPRLTRAYIRFITWPHMSHFGYR